jgi:hypothetical protein
LAEMCTAYGHQRYQNMSSGGTLCQYGSGHWCSSGGSFQTMDAGRVDANGTSCDVESFSFDTQAPYWQDVSNTYSTSAGPTVYTCPDSTWTLQGQTCVKPDHTAGAEANCGWYDWGTNYAVPGASSACLGQDGVTFEGAYPVGRALVGGVYHYFAQGCYKYTGGLCTPGAPSPATAQSTLPVATCPTGQTVGVINGQAQCFSNGQQQNPVPTSTQTTTSNTVTNPDGSTTTIVTNADGTTTTTTTSADGKTTTQDKQTKTDMYCVDHPKDPACGGSVFGGSCAAGFTCGGDAVQCAVAQAAYRSNCELFDRPSQALADVGNNAAAGHDTVTSPAALSERTTVDMPTLGLDATHTLTGGCPANFSVSVVGHSIVVPLSNLCPYLEFMGRIVVAFALVAGMLIVGVA